MLWLAHLFASEGIAVLAYDKRGAGKSGGQFVGGLSAASAANLDLLARDAAAAAATVDQHPRLRGTPVGYVGFSQGGWIGSYRRHQTARGFVHGVLQWTRDHRQ